MARPIDHLVLAAADLDALAALYARLGFLVGGRNRHPWGTQNHIVQLEGSFLELIGLAEDFQPLGEDDPAASFANRLARFLASREGLALVALQSSDANRDVSDFAGLGIGFGHPLHFSRTAEAPDGTRREVAFSTAFTADPALGIPEFFVCQHHRPENFWNPAMRRHPNGAQKLLGIALVADRPSDRRAFLTKLFGEGTVGGAPDDLPIRAGDHQIDVLTPDRFQDVYGLAPVEGGPFAAFRIAVASIEAVRELLDTARLPYRSLGGRIIVSDVVAKGVALSFEPVF